MDLKNELKDQTNAAMFLSLLDITVCADTDVFMYFLTTAGPRYFRQSEKRPGKPGITTYSIYVEKFLTKIDMVIFYI